MNETEFNAVIDLIKDEYCIDPMSVHCLHAEEGLMYTIKLDGDVYKALYITGEGWKIILQK